MREALRELVSELGTVLADDRASTHGDATVQLGLAMRLFKEWDHCNALHGPEYGAAHNAAIFQIMQKLSRIACGRPVRDHYLDIAGYALLTYLSLDDGEAD